jgi:predicted metal-dependent phosphoesterase TrpH
VSTHRKIRPGKRWLKAELHSHCSLDPVDYRVCRYSPEELIDAAASHGYEVLAITCHDLDIWTEDLSDYARNLGVTLIPGMEVTAERKCHVLAYNFHTGPENLNRLNKIHERSTEDTLVVAPHSYYPGRACLRGLLEKNLHVFDAIECSGFLVRGVDFNRKSLRVAQRAAKPLVACADVHYLWQLGRTVTWIYAEADVRSILHSIKNGLTRIQMSPLSWLEAAGWWATTRWRCAFPVNSVPGGQGWTNPYPARH